MIPNGHLLQAYFSDVGYAEREEWSQWGELTEDDGIRSPHCIFYAHFQRMDRGTYQVTFPEFQGCQAQGATFELARQQAALELTSQVSTLLERGDQLPDTIPRIGKDFHPIKILI
jgi:predicted RNase H-like HicB family nuclease